MVYDIWSTKFNPCCKTVFVRINFKINGWGIAMLLPFGENSALGIYTCIEVNDMNIGK